MTRRLPIPVLISLILFAGCDAITYGEGIGRPPFQSVDRPNIIEITEVFVPLDSPENHRIELFNPNGEDFALGDYRLETAFGNLPLSGSIPAGGTKELSADLEALDLLPNIGDLVILSNDDQAVAYLAWGQPAAPESPRRQFAQNAGILNAWSFVELPFPLPADRAIISTSGAAGCGLTSPALAAQSTDVLSPLSCTTSPSALVFTEFQVLRDTLHSFVELENTSATALNLLGLRICHAEGCFKSQSRLLLAPATRQVLYFDTSPTESDEVLDSAIALPSEGELLLLAPGRESLVTEGSILDYLAYGDQAAVPDFEFDVLAEGAGVWPQSSLLIEVGDDVAESAQLKAGQNTADDGPDAWMRAAPTPGL